MRLIKTRAILLAIGLIFLYIKYYHKQKTVSINLLTTKTLKNHSMQLDLNEGNKESPYILSYSLFGDNWERYGSAVETIATSASQSSLYSNWSVRLYHDAKMLNMELQNVYKKKHKNLFFYDVGFLPEFGNISHINGMAWRFLAAGDPNAELMCSRDLDALLLPREEDAVKEWLNSNKIFHVMRDHPLHGTEILGGTWCFRNKKKPSLGNTIAKLVIEKSKRRTIDNEAPFGDGQDVLREYIWPLISDDVLQHDSYLCSQYIGSIPFQIKRPHRHIYIGMITKLPENEVILPPCPVECRPKQHQDWEYC